ncbi:MAG: hypothetical protein GX589_09940 [Deltaproteobacteria bacterium]|nr:hypothetical protein [Deltaproteobacteria bacterium]
MLVERIHKDTAYSGDKIERLIRSIKKSDSVDAVDPELGSWRQRREEHHAAQEETGQHPATGEKMPGGVPTEAFKHNERIDVLA